jgi:cysteine desulfurase/selenocysteine lyase
VLARAASGTDRRVEIPYEPDVRGVALGERARWFPELAPFAYLAHAGVSPASIEVRRASLVAIDHYARVGLSAYAAWRAQRDRLRGSIARLIGAPSPSDIAFVASTTRSVIDVAMSIPWRLGDRIVCLRGEFPANVTPWQRAAHTFGLEIAWLDADSFRTDEGIEALRRELARGVRLVAVSAVEFQTGLAMPIEAIVREAHAAGAEVFVDAIQACGVVPMNVGEIDYLGCGSHKWLMGLEGCAFVYVRADRAAALVPRVAGWTSHEDAFSFLFEGEGHLRYDRPFKRDASVFESGAMNTVGLAGLEGAIALIEALGVPAIFAHVSAYLDALEPALIERGFRSERHARLRSGILSMRPPENASLSALYRALDRRGVACSTPDGRLRFAPHWPNALDEVPRVIAAIDEGLREG